MKNWEPVIDPERRSQMKGGHRHVWVQHTPAVSFLLLESKPHIWCDVCGETATQCHKVDARMDHRQCVLIRDHEGSHDFGPDDWQPDIQSTHLLPR